MTFQVPVVRVVAPRFLFPQIFLISFESLPENFSTQTFTSLCSTFGRNIKYSLSWFERIIHLSVTMQDSLEITVSSAMNSRLISTDRISAIDDDEKTWYDDIRQHHAGTYQFLLNIGAITPKHIGVRYYLTILLYLVYLLAIGVMLYICIEVLMGNVRDVYRSLSKLSDSSHETLSIGTRLNVV